MFKRTYHGSKVRYTCTTGYERLDGDMERTCQNGAWNGSLPTCTEIDECALYGSQCENGATCVDALNDYSCTCATGWRGDHCDTDVDECSEGTPCSNNATCTNTAGGFTCQCVAGWEGNICDQGTV
ncbi:SNED1-like protein [Mya arenaria]|uniref:SNED1-like protein n=1 Tax=Mya arenaria TaxID=6604 RepID=A0ABY7EUU2_MYAAR|nr:SNED1-like protein [Mya arenaria]